LSANSRKPALSDAFKVFRRCAMMPSTRMNPIKAMLKASEIILALVSAPDAMPARSADTDAVIVLVTVALVRPRPMPASTHPGKIN